MNRAAVGAVGAAVLLAPACGAPTAPEPTSRDEPVRRASFRSLAARDFLASCPGAAARSEISYQSARLDELRQLAVRNGAGAAVASGENEWAGLSRYGDRERCADGEEAYRQALAAFSGALDTLAARIADYPVAGGARP